MKKIIYEIFMSVMAIIAVILSITDLNQGLSHELKIIDNMIYLLFVIDYLFRLIISHNKKTFVKDNIPDLISIVPFNSVFRVFRLAKIVRIARLTKLSKILKLSRFTVYILRLLNKCKRFLNTNGFKYMQIITSVSIVLGAVSISIAEGMNMSDSLWWSFVTATTVGYGDISPASLPRRIIAMILMIVGIGLIGSLTSTITSFFLKPQTVSTEQSLISSIQEQLDNFDKLSQKDINDICSTLQILYQNKNK